MKRLTELKVLGLYSASYMHCRDGPLDTGDYLGNVENLDENKKGE